MIMCYLNCIYLNFDPNSYKKTNFISGSQIYQTDTIPLKSDKFDYFFGAPPCNCSDETMVRVIARTKRD